MAVYLGCGPSSPPGRENSSHVTNWSHGGHSGGSGGMAEEWTDGFGEFCLLRFLWYSFGGQDNSRK